jgi:hypothetical protein
VLVLFSFPTPFRFVHTTGTSLYAKISIDIA